MAALILRSRGGIRWESPWFVGVNYGLLIMVFGWMWMRKHRADRLSLSMSIPATSIPATFIPTTSIPETARWSKSTSHEEVSAIPDVLVDLTEDSENVRER
jgi:hypothetical protein